MSISLYDVTHTTAVRGLANLDVLLDKAEANAGLRKIDPAVLLASRLAPDMFPLIRQVQIACDFAKGPIARLAGIENPKFEDVETDIAGLKARIAKTLAFVNGVPASALDGAETRDITIQAGSQTMEFKGQAYLVGFAIPNFYFHLSMAYAILRHNGVDVGKRDFIGPA